ncbi:MAG: winged helix-turn-helix transcriptional regulator [Pseudomonadota bacterium]
MNGPRYAQFCALARAAEILGERWTLLIVRELLLRPRRFTDLVARLAGVSPSVLTSRLKALVDSGLVQRVETASSGGQVYALTESGRALQPAIRELIRWGGRFLFPMRPDDVFEPDWVLLALDAIARRTPVAARRIVLRVPHKPQAVAFLVEGGPNGTTITTGDGPAPAGIEAGFDTLLRLISMRLTLEQAIAEGLAKVEGSMRIARGLPRLFDLSDRLPPSRQSLHAG